MRITNNIMLNSTKSNINGNKVLRDIMNTQMATQKKINVPSDDPIIAVRSLRLRSNVAELTQYADKNIEDAQSWMEVTEASMNNMRDILKSMYNDFTQGDNDYLSITERKAILEDLEALVDQFYSEGNTSYAGRTVFTGYKTNSNAIYKAPDANAVFVINETFNPSDLFVRKYVSNCVTIDKEALQSEPATQLLTQEKGQDNSFPETNDVTVFNLTYTSMEKVDSLRYTDADGNVVDISVNSVRYDRAGDEAYRPDDDEVNYIQETGELVFGKNVDALFASLDDDVVVTATYEKRGFQVGEPNPVMYFDCIDKTAGISVDEESGVETEDPEAFVEYRKETQAIEYNVGFNQKIKVNTEASDVLLLDVKKEIANLRDAITAVEDAQKKKENIKALMEDSRFASDEQQAALQSMLNATEKEIDLKQDRMVSLFKKGVGSMQSYESHVNLQISDIGNRYRQLTMISQRMQQQKTNFEELMTQNEDRELSDIILDYTAANYSYQLSLQATSSISKLSLLNYL